MSNTSLAGCSILICEDEPMIAIGIADAFSNVGARVVTVRSIAQAFVAIEDDAPSAVILDHALCEGEISQLCDCLKEQSIPYVLHKGYSPREYNGAADNAAYVPKPASPQHLVATVEGLLRSRGIAN
jgi:DNA-binding response OmpR family regulator